VRAVVAVGFVSWVGWFEQTVEWWRL